MGEKQNQRLDSWKEIARYLGRDVRTVIRWEKQRSLPIHRVPGGKGHAVFAYSAEVDAWLSGQPRNGSEPHPAPPRPMVAVLPFVNGHGPQSEYLSDGLAESVIRSLGHWSKLRVMSWSAVAPYKNCPADPRRVGSELNAKVVLMGRVAPEENSWRVSVELVDSSDGAQLWGTSYVRSFDQLVAVPERIAGEVARRLQDADPPARNARPAPKPEAFRQYLMGRHCWNQGTGEAMHKALEYYEKAVRVDPTLAEAYAETALCCCMLGYGFGDLISTDLLQRAEAAAHRALELDDTLAEAHACLVWLSPFQTWDLREVEKGLKRAIELNPSYALGRSSYAILLTLRADYEGAIRQHRLALELDPHGEMLRTELVACYCFAERYDEAIRLAKEELQRNAESLFSHYFLGWAYLSKGMVAEAIASLEHCVSISLINTLPLGILGYAYAANSEREKALGVLERLDALAKQRPAAFVSRAITQMGLKDKAGALDSLERAREARSPFLWYMKHWWWFDDLHEEPRFQELARHVGVQI